MSSITAATSLTFTEGLVLMALIVAGMLGAGLVVIFGRSQVTVAAPDGRQSVIRSWIAISLVMGLLLFGAAAFLLDDTQLRSTIFGGLVASVAAAVAFYFATAAANQAGADILAAAIAVPGGTQPNAFSALTPPNAPINTPYLYNFVANGMPAPTYGVSAGQLPDGLTLSTDGTLQGTPTTAGASTFTVTATNAAGSLASAPVTVSVT
jgi:hypothetical protein